MKLVCMIFIIIAMYYANLETILLKTTFTNNYNCKWLSINKMIMALLKNEIILFVKKWTLK
jgi:hypothetical protein